MSDEGAQGKKKRVTRSRPNLNYQGSDQLFESRVVFYVYFCYFLDFFQLPVREGCVAKV